MRDFSIFLVAAALALCACSPAAAQNLPRQGSCVNATRSATSLGHITSLEWSGSRGMIDQAGRRFAGKVVAMRRHAGGFKFSIAYTDPIAGLSEAVVFSMIESGRVRYRVANVIIDQLPDGSRAIGTIIPFEDFRCAVSN